MKCPKCSYVSFDYNLTCPKCDKDISAEQEKLHLPAFRPDSPFLLGALTGEVEESHTGGARGAAGIALDQGDEISFDDESNRFDSGEISIQDSGDFDLGSKEISLDDTDGLSLDSGNASPSGKRETDESLGIDLDTEDAIADLNLEGLGDIEPRPGDRKLSLESSFGEADTEGELALDLGEISGDEGTLDLESLDIEGGPKRSATGAETVTRELRLDKESTSELDKLLEMDEIKLEELSLETKPAPEVKKSGRAVQPPENELSLDLGELDLELDLEDSKPQ